MERIPVPTSRADQVQPFTQDQIEALLLAAKQSKYPYRNQAIIYFLRSFCPVGRRREAYRYCDCF
jgi:hypothetical protein